MFAEALIYSQNIFKIKYATKLTKLTTQRYKQGKKRGKPAQYVTAVWQRSCKVRSCVCLPTDLKMADLSNKVSLYKI